MRILLASAFMAIVFACGGPTKKPITSATEGSDSASETCCCKSNPATSEDGKPAYENGNRMECSQKQGECVPDVQCATSPTPE